MSRAQDDEDALAFMALFSLFPVIEEPKKGAFRRKRLDWEEHMKTFESDTAFMKYYKVSPTQFRELVEMLRPHCESDSKYHHTVSTELQLSVTLRMLAGGSYMDIRRLHGLGRSSVYAYFERVVLALDHVLPRLDFNVNSPSRLQELEDGFARLSCRNHAGEPIYRGVVGAIDGIAINIDRSSLGKDGVKNPQAYFCRKGFF